MNRAFQLVYSRVDYIRGYSAVILLILGILLSYLFISIEYWSIVGPILGVTAGAAIAVVWIFVNNLYKFDSSIRTEESTLPIQVPIILSSFYILTVLVGTRFYLHQRPIWLYLIFGGYAALIAYQISIGESRWRIVLQIVVLAFFTYWSSQLLFPAGMYNPDTYYAYIPNIHEIYATGSIPESQTIYAGHLAMAAEFSMVTGLPPQIAYFLLSTLLLVCTIPIIAIINRALPAVSSKMVLYGALVFSISSWMLRRGMHPNKLNFFYPLILLLCLVTLQLYRSETRVVNYPWIISGLLIMPAIVFGHQFSAGATMVFLLVIAVFALFTRLLPDRVYGSRSQGVIYPFVLVYILSVIGNPVHQGALLRRFSNILLSVVQSESTAGGAGSYSELMLNVLIASTTAQTLLFTLSILGAIWLFQQGKWEYDFIICWLGALSILLVVSLVLNSADTQPQRFYAFLILFGFNICTGALLTLIDYRGIFQSRQISFSVGRSVVIILIFTLAITSLASPIADNATSPVADDIPHFRQFDTDQRIAGDQWTQEYTMGSKQIVGPSSDVPIKQTGPNTGVVNFSSRDDRMIYSYSQLANRTGIMTSVGLSLGGRTYVFVTSPEKPTDSQIYGNGETTVFLRQGTRAGIVN